MRRTLLLILLLVIAIVGLLALSINTNPVAKETAPETIAQTVLSITVPRINPDGTLSSDVLINTNGNKVTAVQLELSYNTADLGNFDVKQGTFFKINSVELLKRIDTDNGKISYALGNGLGQTGVQGTGVVATLTFTKIKTVGITSISFNPKTLVTAEGASKSVLRASLSTKFDLSPVSPLKPTPSTSSAK